MFNGTTVRYILTGVYLIAWFYLVVVKLVFRVIAIPKFLAAFYDIFGSGTIVQGQVALAGIPGSQASVDGRVTEKVVVNKMKNRDSTNAIVVAGTKEIVSAVPTSVQVEDGPQEQVSPIELDAAVATQNSFQVTEDIQAPSFATLSVEIIASIVGHVHDDAIRQVEYPCSNLTNLKFTYTKAIITLTSVSQRLRDIVIGHPRFWSYIKVGDPKTNEEAMVTCLERSKNHGLTIIYTGEKEASPAKSRRWTLLCEHSPRWISLTLVTNHNPYMASLIDHLQSLEAPILTKFHAAISFGRRDNKGFRTFSLPWASLRRVRLYCCSLRPTAFNSSSITRLEISPFSMEFEQLEAAARQLLSLEFLSINGLDAFQSRMWDLDPVETRPITWNSLLELTMSMWAWPAGEDRFWQYLQLFNAPKLRTFTALDPISEQFRGCHAGVVNRVARNMPVVEEVNLLNAIVDAGTFQTLSSFFPKVTKLHLSIPEEMEPDREYGLCSFFDYPGGLANTRTWPHLERLSLGPTVNEEVINSISNCLKHRKDYGCVIPSVFAPVDRVNMVKGFSTGSSTMPTMADYDNDPGEWDPSRRRADAELLYLVGLLGICCHGSP